MFIVDMRQLMLTYFKQRYRSLKGIKICSSCLFKGVYTSSVEYDPSVTIAKSRQEGCKSVSGNVYEIKINCTKLNRIK